MWTARDPDAPPEQGEWWNWIVGIAHSYYAYRLDGETEWSGEVECVWLGGSAGFFGRWKWIIPAEVLPGDGIYDIKLIAEDMAGYRTEVGYQIELDTSGG